MHTSGWRFYSPHPPDAGDMSATSPDIIMPTSPAPIPPSSSPLDDKRPMLVAPTFRLFVLILPSILFAQAEQSLEERNALRLQLASVVQLLVMLQPVAIPSPLLRDVLGWIATLMLYERHNLFVFLLPYLVLRHTFSKYVSGFCGSKISLQYITVTRFSVSDRLMMLCVYPGNMWMHWILSPLTSNSITSSVPSLRS